MCKTKFKYLYILIALIVFVFVNTSSFALGESVSIDGFDENICAPSEFAEGVVTHAKGTGGTVIVFALANNTRGTDTVWGTAILPDGTYAFDIQVPALTEAGDSMSFGIAIGGANGLIVFDILDYICGNGTPFDATDYPTTQAYEPQPTFRDGRINAWDTGNPVVLYGFEDEDGYGLDVYGANEEGLLLRVPANTINAVPACPGSNTIIVRDTTTGIILSRLTERADGSCPFQLNAPTAEAGKTYIVIFNELFVNTYYESWEE